MSSLHSYHELHNRNQIEFFEMQPASAEAAESAQHLQLLESSSTSFNGFGGGEDASSIQGVLTSPDEITASIKDYQHEIEVAGWPSEPQSLRESTSSATLRLLPHVILLLIPIGFVGLIGLGIAVLRINGQAKSATGNAIMQAMAVTSTLWPILFAAVLGPMLKALALHHAVRGARLGVGPKETYPVTQISNLSARPSRYSPPAKPLSAHFVGALRSVT
ncbi:hypothetical protein NX059_005067 [Plenodomus lindquistii]|nr:hypothetical protein NX059_005067 [Plenodomus lindquistii]